MLVLRVLLSSVQVTIVGDNVNDNNPVFMNAMLATAFESDPIRMVIITLQSGDADVIGTTPTYTIVSGGKL